MDIIGIKNPYGLIQQAGKRNSSRKAIYRSRVKSSHCRGKTRCRLRNGCKKTRTNIRKSYCRKRHNEHI